jgi:hypothetical protein
MIITKRLPLKIGTLGILTFVLLGSPLGIQAGIPQNIIAANQGSDIYGEQINVWAAYWWDSQGNYYRDESVILTISASQLYHFRHGLGYNHEGLTPDAVPPFQIELYLDGEEIALQRFSYYDRTGEIYGHPETNWMIFYQIFEPGYFTPDDVEHTWRVRYTTRYLEIDVWAPLIINP